MNIQKLYDILHNNLVSIGFNVIEKYSEYKLGNYLVYISNPDDNKLSLEGINLLKNDDSDYEPGEFIKFITYFNINLDSEKELKRRSTAIINDITEYNGYKIYIRENKIKKILDSSI